MKAVLAFVAGLTLGIFINAIPIFVEISHLAECHVQVFETRTQKMVPIVGCGFRF